MVLLLSEADVAGLVSMQQAIEQLEEAFRQYALGSAIVAPRTSASIPGGGAFRAMSAILPKFFGLKTLTGTPGKRHPHETYFAILLFDVAGGALRAIVASNHLTGLRTGAASGLAAKYLASPESRVAGVFGAGFQAWHQISALRAVRPLEQVRVYDTDHAKAVAFAAKTAQEFSLDAQAVTNPRDAVSGCHLVVTATSATQPVFEGAWIDAGAHVSGVGSNSPAKKELDNVTLTRSKIVVDYREQVLQEAGDIQAAIQAGAITAESIQTGLADVVAGMTPGRTSDHEITLFKSVGVAIEDIAVATFAYEQAMAMGIGQELDMETGERAQQQPVAAGYRN